MDTEFIELGWAGGKAKGRQSIKGRGGGEAPVTGQKQHG